MDALKRAEGFNATLADFNDEIGKAEEKFAKVDHPIPIHPSEADHVVEKAKVRYPSTNF